MGLFNRAVTTVQRCFISVEKWADRRTAQVGPLFILIAAVLITSGIWVYFEIILPEFFPDWKFWPACVYSVYIAYCVGFHYYSACTIPPGYSSDEPWRATAETKLCTKRGDRTEYKPPRAHHCKVCKTCVLKYDHHCPWINACVGLNNERYFVLFMVYLSHACFVVAVLSYRPLVRSLNWGQEWKYRTPRTGMLLIAVLTLVISLALMVLSAWHLVMISRGETSVEKSDNSVYAKLCAKRNRKFIHPYDFGIQENLKIFFNIKRSYFEILIPRQVNPAENGWDWRTRVKLKDLGIKDLEVFTDSSGEYTSHEEEEPTQAQERVRSKSKSQGKSKSK